MTTEIWRYRGWIWEAALGDLRYRYAGSGLGVFWNVVNPLLMLGVYMFIFTQVLQGPRANAEASPLLFPLYLACGFLPWITFADGLGRSAQTFVKNSVLLKKLAIPEIVFVAQTSASTLMSMCISVVLLLALALAIGKGPSWPWLLLPMIVVLWQAFGFGLGMILGTVNVFFRDVAQIVSVAVQIWMWSVPVVYFEEALPVLYRASLPFNPAYPFVVGLRAAIMDTPSPTWLAGAMLVWVVLGLVGGAIILNTLRSEIRDVL